MVKEETDGTTNMENNQSPGGKASDILDVISRWSDMAEELSFSEEQLREQGIVSDRASNELAAPPALDVRAQADRQEHLNQPNAYPEEMIQAAEQIEQEPVAYQEMIKECEALATAYAERSLYHNPDDPQVTAAMHSIVLMRLAEIELRILEREGQHFANKGELFAKMEQLIADPNYQQAVDSVRSYSDKERMAALLWTFRLGKHGRRQFYRQAMGESYDGPHADEIEGMRDRQGFVGPRAQREAEPYIAQVQHNGLPKEWHLSGVADWPETDQEDLFHVLFEDYQLPLHDLSDEVRQRRATELMTLYANAQNRIGFLEVTHAGSADLIDRLRLIQMKIARNLQALGQDREDVYTFMSPYNTEHRRADDQRILSVQDIFSLRHR